MQAFVFVAYSDNCQVQYLLCTSQRMNDTLQIAYELHVPIKWLHLCSVVQHMHLCVLVRWKLVVQREREREETGSKVNRLLINVAMLLTWDYQVLEFVCVCVCTTLTGYLCLVLSFLHCMITRAHPSYVHICILVILLLNCLSAFRGNYVFMSGFDH